MLTRDNFKGLYGLPPTPFKKDGAFDEVKFRENVRQLISFGVDGIITTGTLGEFYNISWEDHKKLIETLVDEGKSKGKVHVIAGCSGVNTDEAIEKSKYAEKCGVDGIMNVSPYYIELAKKDLIQFWKDLAAACPNVGIVVYNNPGTAQFHDLDVYKELAKIPNIVGSKEAHFDFAYWRILQSESPLRHYTASGISLFSTAFQLGSEGITSIFIAIFPSLISELYKECKQKNWEKAWELNYRAYIIWNDLNNLPYLQEYHRFARYKAVAKAFGYFDYGYMHRPFSSIPDNLQEKLSVYVKENYGDLVRK